MSPILKIKQMSLFKLALLLISCVLYPQYASASVGSTAPTTIVFAEASRAPSHEEINIVTKITNLPRPDLKQLLPLPDEQKTDEMFNQAKDTFFNGDYLSAKSKFEEIQSILNKKKDILWSSPVLAHKLFLTFMYLAMISAEIDHAADIDSFLNSAITQFETFSPSLTEFPPWLVNKYSSIKNKTPSLPDRPDEPHSFTVFKDTYIKLYADNIIISIPDSSTEKLIKKASVLSQKAGFQKTLLVISYTGGLKFYLIDHSSRVIRHAMVGRFTDSGQLADAIISALQYKKDEKLLSAGSLSKAKWYTDVTAWIISGTGLAAFTTGLITGLAKGNNSPQETTALALQLSGLTLMASGLTLFIVPDFKNETKTANIRLSAIWTF